MITAPKLIGPALFQETGLRGVFLFFVAFLCLSIIIFEISDWLAESVKNYLLDSPPGVDGCVTDRTVQ